MGNKTRKVWANFGLRGRLLEGREKVAKTDDPPTLIVLVNVARASRRRRRDAETQGTCKSVENTAKRSSEGLGHDRK